MKWARKMFSPLLRLWSDDQMNTNHHHGCTALLEWCFVASTESGMSRILTNSPNTHEDGSHVNKRTIKAIRIRNYVRTYWTLTHVTEGKSVLNKGKQEKRSNSCWASISWVRANHRKRTADRSSDNTRCRKHLYVRHKVCGTLRDHLTRSAFENAGEHLG